MKRTLLIINPVSGTLSKEGLATRVRERLAPAGFGIETVETEYAGHGSELARAAMREGYHAVIAAGGDGTVNEVASAMRLGQDCPRNTPYGIGQRSCETSLRIH